MYDGDNAGVPEASLGAFMGGSKDDLSDVTIGTFPEWCVYVYRQDCAL
jgi:hypothetical protein